MNGKQRATFAVGIFEACDVARKALIELVALGYRQRHLFLIRPIAPVSHTLKATPPRDVEKLVIPLTGQLSGSSGRIEIGASNCGFNGNGDAEIIQDMGSWLPIQNFSTIAAALHDRHTVLFVRMHEQQQFAPTCAVLLSHCTQNVTTHDVFLPYR